MRVRIGFGLGTGGLADASALVGVAGELERLGFDSLWLSERVTGGAPDPLVALSVAAGATLKLKLGTSVLVVPGRNPYLLAKQLATLDALSGGRLLLAVGLGAPEPAEHSLFGIERAERGALFDEAVPLMRRLWSEDAVDHDGPRFAAKAVTIRPRPVQSPLEVWLGGRAAGELRRVGRLGDGWLPSFATPAQAAEGRVLIEQTAGDLGREIDPGHFGALIVYCRDEVPARLVALAAARNPDAASEDLLPCGHEALRALIERFMEERVTKFVVVPAFEPADWEAELGAVANAVLPVQDVVLAA